MPFLLAFVVTFAVVYPLVRLVRLLVGAAARHPVSALCVAVLMLAVHVI